MAVVLRMVLGCGSGGCCSLGRRRPAGGMPLLLLWLSTLVLVVLCSAALTNEGLEIFDHWHEGNTLGRLWIPNVQKLCANTIT